MFLQRWLQNNPTDFLISSMDPVHLFAQFSESDYVKRWFWALHPPSQSIRDPPYSQDPVSSYSLALKALHKLVLLISPEPFISQLSKNLFFALFYFLWLILICTYILNLEDGSSKDSLDTQVQFRHTSYLFRNLYFSLKSYHLVLQ